MSFLNLQNTPYKELATVRLRVVDEDLLPPLIRGRAWCAINLTMHGAKIFVKPIVYLIASITRIAFSSYRNKGKPSVDDLKQSGRFLACAILSPFSEAINTCKAAAGIIYPQLYYHHIVGIGVALVDATYETNGEGNLDYSYVNPELGLGFVIDGAGHGDPARKRIQDPIIRKFVASYEKDLRESHFNTTVEAQQFVQGQMNTFGREFNRELADYAPAIMFTQIIKIGNKRYLFTAHMSDTALYIRTGERWRMESSPQRDIGFGSDGTRGGEINIPRVNFREVSLGDELIGFTDGIGEFLTQSECCDVLESNDMRPTLLAQFKQKIIEKGKRRASEGRIGGSERGMAANGGRAIKFHNPDLRHKQDHDDISLFSLVVK